MINSITGIVTEKGAGFICLETHGIEWKLHVSAHSLDIGAKVGDTARLLVYLHHKEDLMQLFGFSSEIERSLFLDLLRVSGIGARQAQKILSGITIEDFIRVLDAGDVEKMSSIPGLGKKTAQKVILALRGSLSFKQFQNSDYNEIVQGLVEMGFDKKKATDAVKQAEGMYNRENMDTETYEKEVFKQAIILLSR